STKAAVATGTAVFGAVLLLTVSVVQILEGIAALANDKLYVIGVDYVFEFDVTTWGWIHLLLGVFGVLTGIGLLLDQTWARFVGIVVAAVAIVANFAFLPYYPWWSIVVIAILVFVIWALSTQLANERR
ncbi:MAG: hypothetical protein AAGC49_09800, partial [Brevundimonas sp.]